MTRRIVSTVVLALMAYTAGIASAQTFQVQCPTSTITHPNAANNNSEPAYSAPTNWTPGSGGFVSPNAVNGAIKCQQISGGDGYATMGDGTQTYMFSFGPLSGLADIANGLPGTQFPSMFQHGLVRGNALLARRSCDDGVRRRNVHFQRRGGVDAGPG